MKVYVDEEHRFAEMFNEETGFYVRSGVMDLNGEDTGVDPFMRNYPSLIDVGIMGGCIHGKSGLCIQSGVECYQNGLNISKSNMSFDNFKKLIDESAGKSFQFALGGRGDANKHEEFGKFIEYAKSKGIICNYTTSGLQLTEEEVRLTKEFCGACAVSEYRSPYTRKAIQMLVDAGMKTNIHYVLSNSSIDEAINKLENNGFDEGINAVIFLLHKPVGLGSWENVLRPDNIKVNKFFEIIDNNTLPFKVGFDSCSCSGIVNFTSKIAHESIEPCEAARHSMYIDAEMNAMPCSFCNQDSSQFVSLNTNTIKNAWDGVIFENFRNKAKNACVGCKMKHLCSPCPAIDGISLCERENEKIKRNED